MGKDLRTQARRVLLQQIAPAYHRALRPQKQEILEHFVITTGYARKYALWLLHHVEEVLAPPTALRRRYGPEVEEALVLAWKTLNRICTKRLIPFLLDLLETLEEEGHVHLNQEHRSQLLSMSTATADRLLQAYRYTHPHGLSTTQAGPLLKQQIPIRTFAQWDEAKPGFLEVDLVVHCGGRLAGRLPLHDHADRCRHRVDGVFALAQPWARSGPGCPPACPDVLSVSHPGTRH